MLDLYSKSHDKNGAFYGAVCEVSDATFDRSCTSDQHTKKKKNRIKYHQQRHDTGLY